jgi:hypothetical protein
VTTPLVRHPVHVLSVVSDSKLTLQGFSVTWLESLTCVGSLDVVQKAPCHGALPSICPTSAGDDAAGSEAGYDSEYEEEASYGDNATVPATVPAEDRQEYLARLPYLAALSPLPPPAWLEEMRHWLPAEPTRAQA